MLFRSSEASGLLSLGESCRVIERDAADACFSGGAALNMGAEYLLMSIAVVVIGGTAVAGGDSNVPGIWGASLFMFLIVSMLNTYGFSAGFRLISTGAIIITVILLASRGPSSTR